MSNNISLNDVKNGAFFAKQSYETFNTSVDGVKDKITNPATNSSFEVVKQKTNTQHLKKALVLAQLCLEISIQ